VTEDPMARMREDFVSDASDTVDRISHSLAGIGHGEAPSSSCVDWVFRAVHSLKGTSGMFGLTEVSALAASLEDLLELIRSGKAELDASMLDLLVESFDEMAILLQQARGEEVQGAWSEVKSKLDRRVSAASSAASSGVGCNGQSRSNGLPADLGIMLGPDEVAEIGARLRRGDRLCTVSLEFDGLDASEHEEAALRQLQEMGKIVSILPPEGNRGTQADKRTLSMIYAPSEGDIDVRGLAGVSGATVRYMTPQPADGSGASAVSAPETSPSAPRGLADLPREPTASLSVKVDICVLDAMMNIVSELYSVRLGLLGFAKRLPHSDETRRLRDDLLKIGLILNNRVGSLEESIVAARLVPASLLFERYRGEVRRLARQSGKKVSLEFQGEATRIDRAMLDGLHDPLLHIIRNAVDHGIESPAERLALDKPEIGRILLRARQEAGHICIEIEDDGRGVDFAKVRREAVEKGVTPEMMERPLDLIFRPGISTRDDVSDISGRGVGLDAAKTKIEALKGMITAESVPRRGARFCVYVPLTLAISRGVLVEESSLPLVIPIRSVIEVLALGKDRIPDIRLRGTLVHRGSPVKAVALSEMLGVQDRRDPRSAVILGVGEARRALLAHKVGGETEIICRPLPEAVIAPRFITGATELHDGRPAIVIQPEELLRGPSNGQFDSHRGLDDTCSRLGVDGGVGKMPVRLFIFRSGNADYGIPLSLLKEVISLRSLSEIPVLGDCWTGLFFHRGMCHGLLSVAPGRRPGSDFVSAAILRSPERCAIGISEIYGNSDFPVEEIMAAGPGGSAGLVRPCGRIRWRDGEITIIEAGKVHDKCEVAVSGDRNR
jgi:two-component system chemotaxis sensor kinase CheA